MTAQFKAKGMKLASVEEVSAGIVAGIAGGKSVVYVPGKWRLIMTIIQHIPAFVFNKLNI
jgi:hypothetical protein